jgi:protein-disulfide isomerase
MTQIEKEYIDTGKVKHVFMDFPLPMHANAQKAAEAAFCADDQGKYWEMHKALFAQGSALTPDALLKHAEAIGLDKAKFKECLDNGKRADAVKKQMAEGQKAGVTGTPAFLIGFIEPDGKVKATKKISGAVPFANIKSVLDEMLSSKKQN